MAGPAAGAGPRFSLIAPGRDGRVKIVAGGRMAAGPRRPRNCDGVPGMEEGLP